MFEVIKFDKGLDELKEMVFKSPALNYFICMAFESSLSVYESIAVKKDSDERIIIAVFLRKSGNLQIAIHPEYNFNPISDPLLFEALRQYIQSISYKTLIIPEIVFKKIETGLPHLSIKSGAEIEMLNMEKPFEVSSSSPNGNHKELMEGFNCRRLKANDLEEVESLYKIVFKGHPSKAYMIDKFQANRGMGFGIWMGTQLISVAQTDFDNEVIVGVATHPDFQGKGYSKLCLKTLLNAMYPERKRFYLQVENPTAIKLYQLLGFEPISKILHVTNSR